MWGGTSIFDATPHFSGLTLVTRNTSDVQDIDVNLHNPFAR